MKFFAKLHYFLLPAAFLLHISLIFLHGYFLSIEFTLYPYLVAHGFLPYQNIIDQHFPTLLFGPFSLPAWLTVNPFPLLLVFLAVLCLTDLFFYAALVRFKIRQPFLWLVFYIVTTAYFSGNILWIETFINLLLAIWFFLSHTRSSLSKFISGLIISQIFILRPTIFLALLLLFPSLSVLPNIFLFGGVLVGFLVPGLYLFNHGLLPDFYRLAIIFNQEVYPHEALLLPAKRQLLYLFLWLVMPIYALAKKRQFFALAALVCLLLLIFPRFGFEHLQPLFLCGIFLWAIKCQPSKITICFLIVVMFCLNIISSVRHSYGNYFLNPNIQKISDIVRDLPGNQIYLLGASDIIYPLSGKLPPKYIYLPSLPWYFSQPDFVNRLTESLSHKDSWVLVDYTATTDGRNLVESSGDVFKYIRMNFVPGQKIDHYQFFYPKP